MNLKGHVCIDLHNHKSGFTERLEGDNLITDALNNYFKYGITTYTQNGIVPLTTNALGGICLIDRPFLSGGESYIPAEAKFIAGGSYNFNDTNSRYMGTYNLLESGWDEDIYTYTHVYDYTTSQANGTIGAIALTTKDGGKNCFIPKARSGDAYYQLVGDNHTLLYIDTEDKYVYYTKQSSGDNIPIYKSSFAFDAIALNQSGLDINASGEVNTGKTIDNPHQGWYDGHDGYIYYPYVNDSSQAYQSTLHIRVVDVSDFTEDTELEYDFPAPIKTTNCFALDMEHNYIWTVSSDGERIYRYNTSNDQITTFIVSEVFGGSAVVTELRDLPLGGVHGLVDISNVGQYRFRLSNTNTLDYEPINYPNAIGSNHQIQPYGLSYYFSPTSTPGRWITNIVDTMMMSNYNLSELIVKGSNQSMRVTYAITQV